MSNNGYPPQILREQERRASVPNRQAVARKCKRAANPYARGVSDALARVFNEYGVWVAHVPSSKLRGQMKRVKDPLERSRYPGVVYKIPCRDCDATYVGETGNFNKRIKQHQYDVAKGNSSSNALSEDHENTGHCIDWASASIIATEKKLPARLMLESLHIQTTQHAINRTRGNLPEIYTRALRHLSHI